MPGDLSGKQIDQYPTKVMREDYYNEAPAEQKNDFQEVQRYLLKILGKWYWLAGSLLVALLIAFYLTSTADRVYQVGASVLVKDPETMSNTVKNVLYREDQARKSSNSIENETLLIRRFDLIRNTLEDLNYQVIVQHKNSPIKVTVDSSSTYQPNVTFACQIQGRQTFTLATEHDDFAELVEGRTFKFGEIINLDDFVFTIFLDLSAYEKYLADAKEAEEEKPIAFKVNNLDDMTDYYMAVLEVEPASEQSTVLTLQMESDWPAQDVRFLNRLTENYLESGIEEKVSTATQTMKFIDRQLGFISDSLSNIEEVRRDFKQTQSVDLSKEGSQLYDDIQALEREKANHMVQIQYLTYLRDYVQDESNDFEFVTAPSSMGVQDNVLSSLIDQLVTEQMKLNQVKTGTNIENPRVRLTRQKIKGLRQNIAETANNLLKGNRIASNELERQVSKYESELSVLPEAERRLIDIERQYKLSEALYVFLMEKRTEAGILKASTMPDLQVVNRARVMNGGRPVSPKPLINYATAVILGLFFPILFIYLKDKINDKVDTPEELSALTQVPLLGMVGQHKAERTLVANQPQSATAEAFRNIRSNLRYMTEYGRNCQTFMLSSFVSGEGKTFCAKNLAYTFAIAGKKTVYINTDLRKNNTYEEFGLTKTTGLSEYLIDIIPQGAVMHSTQYDNLFVIPSGKIPPNPSELLMKEKFRDLILRLQEEFDYIILDTPPRGMLSDAMELIKYADVEIFVVRQGYTIQQNVVALERMYQRHQAKQPMSIIFNDVDFSKVEYGMYKNSFAYNYPAEG